MRFTGNDLRGFVLLSEAIQLNNGRYQDDHRVVGNPVLDLHGIVEFIDSEGMTSYCPFIPNVRAFCLNPLYVDKVTGQVRLSTTSIGGTVVTNGEPIAFRTEHYRGLGTVKAVYELDTNGDGEFLLRQIYHRCMEDV